MHKGEVIGSVICCHSPHKISTARCLSKWPVQLVRQNSENLTNLHFKYLIRATNTTNRTFGSATPIDHTYVCCACMLELNTGKSSSYKLGLQATICNVDAKQSARGMCSSFFFFFYWLSNMIYRMKVTLSC